jgi:pyruvate dehydrogenase E2 component (dihydrolipoamide acetyltransferase)
MAYEFKLPDLGEGVAEGEVVRWLVAEGDVVSEDQPLAEVLTDKATVEIPSPRAGRIVRLGAAEGERVPVGHVLVVIEENGVPVAPSGEEVARATLLDPATVPPVPVAPAMSAGAESGPPPTGPAVAPTVRPAAREAAGLLRAVEATPAVRALARELGVDLAQVEGTGPGGRITAADVRRTAGSVGGRAEPAAPAAGFAAPAPAAPPAAAPAAAPAAEAAPGERRVPLRGLRRRIAEAMSHAHRTVPQFTFVAEADFGAVVDDRERRRGEAEAAGIKLTYLAYVLRALPPSLRAYPMLNASLDDERQEIVLKEGLHVAIAVATPEGLTVPVLHDVDRLDLTEIARQVETLAEAGRAQRLRPEQLSGATFTVTTTGALGGVLATPIVHHPQVAILGVHAVTPKPVVRDGQIVVRPIGNLSLSMDHRVIDGQLGAEFLYDLIGRLQSPETWA